MTGGPRDTPDTQDHAQPCIRGAMLQHITCSVRRLKWQIGRVAGRCAELAVDATNVFFLPVAGLVMRVVLSCTSMIRAALRSLPREPHPSH